VLFSALLALALFDTCVATAQDIKLTARHIQGFMAAYEDMANLYAGANQDKPDPKVEAQAAVIAKKNDFASLAQYEDASTNIVWGQPGSRRYLRSCRTQADGHRSREFPE
jgi:hypothetical protein